MVNSYSRVSYAIVQKLKMTKCNITLRFIDFLDTLEKTYMCVYVCINTFFCLRFEEHSIPINAEACWLILSEDRSSPFGDTKQQVKTAVIERTDHPIKVIQKIFQGTMPCTISLTYCLTLQMIKLIKQILRN